MIWLSVVNSSSTLCMCLGNYAEGFALYSASLSCDW